MEGGKHQLLSFLKFIVCSIRVKGRLKGNFNVGKGKAETFIITIFFYYNTQLLCDLTDVEFAEEYMHCCKIQICILNILFFPPSPLHVFLPNYKCKPSVNDALFAVVGRQSENNSADGFDCLCVRLTGH